MLYIRMADLYRMDTDLALQGRIGYPGYSARLDRLIDKLHFRIDRYPNGIVRIPIAPFAGRVGYSPQLASGARLLSTHRINIGYWQFRTAELSIGLLKCQVAANFILMITNRARDG